MEEIGDRICREREREGGRWGLRGGGGGDYNRLTHGVFFCIIKLQRYRFLVFFFLKFWNCEEILDNGDSVFIVSSKNFGIRFIYLFIYLLWFWEISFINLIERVTEFNTIQRA